MITQIVKLVLLSLALVGSALAEENLRDKLVREAQKAEKSIGSGLTELREKTCRAVKGKPCLPVKKGNEPTDSHDAEDVK